MTLDTTKFAPFFKRLWPNGYKEALYDDIPTLGVLPKDTGFYGEAKAVPIHISGINGSNDFAEALANESDAEVRRFLVTRVKDYATAKVDSETLKASGSEKGAAGKAIAVQTRAALYTMSRSIGRQLFAGGDGYIGTVASASTNTITLSDARDVINFELGQAIGVYDDSGSADLTAASAGVWPVVTKVNRESGVITFSGNVAGSSLLLSAAVAANDKLYRVGDSAAGVGGASGLGAWLPLAAPTGGDSFFGVDRSDDPVRLAGNRIVGNGTRMEDVLIDGCAQVMINGGKPDLCVVNPMKFAELNKSAYAKTEFCDIKTDIARIGYKGLVMPTASGMVQILPDPQCPYATGFLLTKSTWEVCSLGALPHRVTDDGLQVTRAAAADAIAFRFRAYWNVLCHAPHKNARITW